MKRWAVAFFICVAFVCVNCQHQPIQNIETDNQLKLRWIKSYPTENQQKVDIGIQWFLSFLGAKLETGSYAKTLKWQENNILLLDISEAGFATNTQNQFKTIFGYFKDSDEYQKMGAIDLGRFISVLMLSSPHYYALTNVPEKLSDFINQRTTDTVASILNSTVSISNRLIRFPLEVESFQAEVFIATEGEIDANGSQTVIEFEVMDIMPNGQLRFGIYDSTGNRVDFADSTLGTGGKPSKCLWCHEININKNFLPHTGHSNYMSVDSFNAAIQRLQVQLMRLRAALSTDIQFDSLQHHTYAELLYLGYMEPNLSRLAGEWQLTEAEVITKLGAAKTHPHHEFSFLGEVYFRKDIEGFSPYLGLQASDFAREQSLYEPNYLP